MLTSADCTAIFNKLDNLSEEVEPDHYIKRLRDIAGKLPQDWQRQFVLYLQNRIFHGG